MVTIPPLRAFVLATLSCGLANAQVASFPDDWFYSGSERPAKLRALEGQPAPALSIAEWRGSATTIAEARGKVVVVDFWATWCGPCMAAIPKNVQLVEAHRDDVVFIGVHDAKNGWQKVDQVIADKGINYPVGKDDGGTSTKAYSLSFWPTYVVIDKSGVVRGAGLRPDKVDAAVHQLLAEDGPSPAASASAAEGPPAFPDDWFLGGAKRPASFREVEGSTAPKLEAAAWTNGDAPRADALGGSVVVYQFLHPAMTPSLLPLQAMGGVVEAYAGQGVVFVGVCDARGDFAAMGRIAEERGVAFPIAQDQAGEGDVKTGPKAEGPGRFTRTLGVRFPPATVVVDRAGIVRAAGLQPGKLSAVLDRLLAEPMPEAPAKEAPAKEAGEGDAGEEAGKTSGSGRGAAPGGAR